MEPVGGLADSGKDFSTVRRDRPQRFSTAIDPNPLDHAQRADKLLTGISRIGIDREDQPPPLAHRGIGIDEIRRRSGGATVLVAARTRCQVWS